MDGLIRQVLKELRSAWRFRWWGAALSWVAFLGGLVWVATQANVFQASARVYIDTSSVLRPILSNQIVPPDIATQLQYVSQALFGREQLERVARATNLDVAAVTPTEREAVLNGLRSGIRLEASGGGRRGLDNIYTIRYRNSNRDTAIAVVSTLLNALVEDTLSANREGSDVTERFLDARIQEYEERLQRAETALADFKRENADRLPGAEGDYFARIQRDSAALEQAEKVLRIAESRRAQLLEQLQSETPVAPSSLAGEAEPPPNSIDGRIRSYQQQLDRLLLEFTERHPDVIAVRTALTRLEEQRAEQLSALGISDADQELSALASNPIYQAIQIAINEADAEIASLTADVEERRRQLAELQALMDEVPEVEAELARLNRDYQIIYDQYLALVRSRETQDLSQKAASADQVEFRVIDPPLASFQPVAPDRLRLLAMAFIGSLMAGAGLCWLLAQLRPVFGDTAALREISGFPVLGAVTKAWEARDRMVRRMAVVTFVCVMAGLFAVFSIGALIEIVGPGLHAIAS